MHPPRIVFMGTPAFAVPVLDSLHKAGYQLVAVYTQPPRPAGRGHKRQYSPVHARALELDIPVYTPVHFKEITDQQQFQAHKTDVAIVVAYGLILKKPVLEAPRFGCINIHASLLPRWRGAAPVQRAIMAGDQETGITIMQMDEGLDTGDMLMNEKIAITPATDSTSLHTQLSLLGARLVLKTLEHLQSGQIKRLPQPAEGITYAHKLQRNESILDWNDSASVLERKVRALNPWPGTAFTFNHETIKVLEAEVILRAEVATPGTVIDSQLTIACGDHAFRPLVLQRPGKTPVSAREFLKGVIIPPQTRLPLP